MSDSPLTRGRARPGRLTESFADDQHHAGSRKVNCRVAIGSGTGFTDEMSRLLRSRLQLVILIMLAGFAVQFLRNLLQLDPSYDHRPVWLVLRGCEIALMVSVFVLLRSRWPLSRLNLRALELIIFGSIAANFAWLQVDTLHDGALLRAIVPGYEPLVFRLVGLFSALRWFILIVLYGIFIPNTWRRCAVIVIGLALLPVILMLASTRLDQARAPYVLSAFPEMVVLMAMAVAIALFGSHKIHQLHARAHEARRIGQYRLGQVIGFGGMGTVYKAEHVLLRRQCAIKLIRADQAGDPKTLMRFEREVRAAATLTHWNTIEIFDYGHTEDGTFYYVMEYLPGMNLEDLVEEHGPLPPERAIYFVRQVCQALREAHAIGLIHRDVKPSNIFASERGKVFDVAKLLDFGLVKTYTDDGRPELTRDGTLTGSPAFMSPEQALGIPRLDARSDIYSVGAVAYYLTTGKLPFDRESTLQMLHAHAYEAFAPEFDEAVPADLQRVILRCLEKDPERRYPDALTLEKTLEACEGASRWTAEKAETWWRRRMPVAESDSAANAGNPNEPEIAARS